MTGLVTMTGTQRRIRWRLRRKRKTGKIKMMGSATLMTGVPSKIIKKSRRMMKMKMMDLATLTIGKKQLSLKSQSRMSRRQRVKILLMYSMRRQHQLALTNKGVDLGALTMQAKMIRLMLRKWFQKSLLCNNLSMPTRYLQASWRTSGQVSRLKHPQRRKCLCPDSLLGLSIVLLLP